MSGVGRECCSLLLMEHKLHLHLINTEKSDFSSPKKKEEEEKGVDSMTTKVATFLGGEELSSRFFQHPLKLNLDIQRGVFDESSEADDKISTILFLFPLLFNRLTTGILDFVHQ